MAIQIFHRKKTLAFLWAIGPADVSILPRYLDIRVFRSAHIAAYENVSRFAISACIGPVGKTRRTHREHDRREKA